MSDGDRGRRDAALDRHLPVFDVNEVHGIELEIPPQLALELALAIPAAPDRLVRALFRLRGLRGTELSLERFVGETLGLATVERTETTFVAVGRLRGLRLGVSFEAEARREGALLATETRVGEVGLPFRLYWLVVGPFSALIRRRWLHAVARAARDKRAEALSRQPDT